MYTKDDLYIVESPIEWIKSNKSRFIWEENEELQISKNIANEAVILSEGKYVTSLQKGNWWIIASEVDWLRKGSPKYLPSTDNEAFTKIFPLPEAGQNSIRSEVLLIAFAKDVVTVLDSTVTVIKGKLSNDIQSLLLSEKRKWKRIVAFCM
jgi:hypothetical protein